MFACFRLRKDCIASKVVTQAQSDLEAFELCIHAIANLSCVDELNVILLQLLCVRMTIF
jgi:hypothetical protein